MTTPQTNTKTSITTTNHRICSFYDENPLIDFETANHIFIDLFEIVSRDLANRIQPNISSQVLSNIDDLKTSINSLNTNISQEFENYIQCMHRMNSEKNIEILLNKTFPNMKITQLLDDNTFLVSNLNPKIIIHNNMQTSNVLNDKTDHFIKMTQEYKSNGIFLAHNSNIVDKNNYQIDIRYGHIIIYIPMANYSVDKIQNAVEIIKNISHKLQEINTAETDYVIPKIILEEINREYQQFESQKENISNFVKENHKKLINQIDALKFCSLDKFLSTKLNRMPKQGYKCDLCENFTVGTLKGMAAHKRGCSRKNILIPRNIKMNPIEPSDDSKSFVIDI